VRDPSKIALSNFLAIDQVANAGQADFATLWWDHTTPVDGSVHASGDFPHEVLTVAYTGDLVTHRAQIEAVWGGPVCMIRHAHSARELGHIVEAINGTTGRALGFAVLDAQRNDIADRVDLTTVIATPAMQATADREFGVGVVHLEPRMLPVAR
jgi:hypothetical protein